MATARARGAEPPPNEFPEDGPYSAPVEGNPPPHNIEVEQALLGAILLNPVALDHIGALSPGCFYEPLHRTIFETMKARHEAGRAIDLRLLIDALGELANAKPLVGMTVGQYVARLAAEATSVANAPDYARTTREFAHRRDALRLAEDLRTAAVEGGDIREIAAGAAVLANPEPQAIKHLALVRADTWDGKPLPRLNWLASTRIPMGVPTLLSGDGAAGKTLISLQLCVGAVRGTDWLGSVIETSGPAIFFTAEEDEDEVQRRLDAIAEHHQISFRDLAGLHVYCLPGEDAVLGAVGKDGIVRPTSLFERLEKSACDIRPSLVVIEAAADVFAIDEINRSHVRQAIQLLRRMGIGSGAAIVLIQHPSVSGMADGSGRSGSTHWRNSVRSQLYLAASKQDGEEGKSDIRELRVMKSNYGPAGEVVQVRWQKGVFVMAGSSSTVERAAAQASVDVTFLRLLELATAQGRAPSPNKSSTYAPAMFQDMPDASGIRSKAFAEAMERLFSAGQIKVVEAGPPSKRRKHLVRT